MPGQKRNKRIGRQSGQQLVEVACALMVLIPIFLFLFDVYFVFLASNMNDGVARDAARAAAAAEPNVASAGRYSRTTGSPDFDRAQSVVAQAQRNLGGYLRSVTLENNSITLQLNAPLPSQTNGGPYNGVVVVRTILDFQMPVTIPGLMPPTQRFTSEASMPITAQRVGTLQQPGSVL